MATLTNRKTAQAQTGQDVIFTLNGADSITYLSQLELDMECKLDSNNKLGYISEIDLYGHSFKIKPVNPSLDFANTPQFLEASETITVTI